MAVALAVGEVFEMETPPAHRRLWAMERADIRP